MTEPPTGRIDALLASSPLFEALEGEDHQRIGAVLERRVLLGGSVLFREGQLGTSLYVVAYGRLQVTVTCPDGTERVIAEVGRGETVGEMALLTSHPRSATVRAVRDSLLLRLTRTAFEELARAHPRILWRLAGELVGRLQRGLSSSPSTGRATTLALVAGSPSVSLPEFAGKFIDALARLGPSQHVDRSFAVTLTSARTLASDDGTHESALAQWLNDHESRYQFILYEADGAHPGWTRRCLRQADRILFVANAGDTARDLTQSLHEDAPSRIRARRDLVLIHPDRTAVPSGTEAWLEACPSIEGSVHHVAETEVGDFDRVARLVTGHGIGLVLGGGGARGFAHIGVLRALREAKIPIDAVCGTSAGSIMGAQFACGWEPDEMMEATRKGFLGGSLLDYTLPLVSLCAGKRSKRMLQTMFGDRRVEDLWLRYFSVSSSLTRGEPRFLRRGPLWRCVGASMAIPGIGPPLCERGELLVDGSVLLDLPVDEMRRVCGGGRVIAVSVSAPADLSVDPSYDFCPSPFRILASRVSRAFGPKVDFPHIVTILTHTAMLGSRASERDVAERADLYLQPELSGVDLLDFGALERVEQIGYRHAVERLSKWRQASVGLPAA